MIKKIELGDRIKEITNIFSENFDDIYTFMEKETKPEILNLAPAIFRKWYYGTIVENTILSPANIIGTSDIVSKNKNSVFAINLSVDNTKRGKNKFIYTGILYNIENHPIIEDLKIAAEKCLPDAPADENGAITKEYAYSVSKYLSMNDPFYAEYIFNLIYRFKLLNILPSIHSYRVQLSSSADSFFKKGNEIILRLIIDESIKICAEKISSILELPNKTVSFDTIYSLLQKPISADDIFEKIYSSIGVDINKIWEASEKNQLSQYDMAILSSTFYIGIIIDKYFMSIFSGYLKITEPFYASGMSFRNTINSLAEIITLKKDTGLEIFSPCSYYKLTSLGKKLIYGYSEGDKPIQKMPENISFNDIVDAVTFEHGQLKILNAQKTFEAKKTNVYEFKMWYGNNENLWKVTEVLESLTLEELGNEICICFAFENIVDFSFIIEDSNGFPVEYISKFSKRPSLNKTEKYKISDLNILPGDIIKFNPTFEKDLRLYIKCIDVHSRNGKIVYPRIKSQSESITKEEEDFELI